MNSEGFKNKILHRAERLRSKLILNLDLTDADIFHSGENDYGSWFSKYKSFEGGLYKKLFDLSNRSHHYLAAIKINYPPIEALGYAKIKQLIEELKTEDRDLPFIADRKITDVGFNSYAIAKPVFDVGFDAVTVIPVGFEGGIQEVFKAAGPERGVIYVSNMSHPGAEELYGLKLDNGKHLWEYLTEKAVSDGANGIIVPATKPNELKRMLEIADRKLLSFAVGVGKQGGVPGDSVKLGADFEMVGRDIYEPYIEGNKDEAIKRVINLKEKIWENFSRTRQQS